MAIFIQHTLKLYAVYIYLDKVKSIKGSSKVIVFLKTTISQKKKLNKIKADFYFICYFNFSVQLIRQVSYGENATRVTFTMIVCDYRFQNKLQKLFTKVHFLILPVNIKIVNIVQPIIIENVFIFIGFQLSFTATNYNDGDILFI